MEKKGLVTLLNGICVIVVALSLMVGIPTAVQAQAKPITFNVYYHGGPRGGQSLFYQDWIKNVEKATGGRVKMTFYPGAVLGPPMEAYEMIKSGAVDMGCIVQGFYPGRFPLSNVVQLPLLGLPSAEVGSRIFWELYEKFPALRADYPDVRVLILYTDAPTPICTRKPVRKAEDLRGMKIRALAGAPSEMLKELGASPVLMPPTEIYTSMERGVIDGYMISWEGLCGMRYQEVTEYFLTANMYQPTLGFVMNVNAWKRLPPDIQKIFDEYTGAAGAEFFGKEFDRYNDECKEQVKPMKGKEIIQLSPEQVARWEKITRPVWDRWLADMKAKGLPGKAVLDEAERLVKKYTKK
jgi:TRAP-type C4-dicarboxylate transport system substrate-binding protein